MHISKSLLIDTPAEDVWRIVKGPEGWADWHPSIGAVEPLGFGNQSYLKVIFDDGGSVVERPLGVDGTSFAYEIIAGQTTVTGYRGTLSVIDMDEKSLVIWNLLFEPLAEGTYERFSEGFVEVGLQALAHKLTK